MAELLSDQIKKFIFVGFSLAIAIVSVVLSKDEINVIIKNDPLHAILALCLFIATLLFLIFWIIFGFREAEFLQKYIQVEDEDIEPIYNLPLLLPIILGILFGLLFAFAINLKVYLPIVIFLYLTSFYGDSQILKLLSKKLFDQNKTDAKGQYSAEFREEIFKYYFQNDYMLRGGITNSLLFIGYLILHSSLHFGMLSSLHLAYIVTILSILFNELLVWHWRNKRRKSVMIIRRKSQKVE